MSANKNIQMPEEFLNEVARLLNALQSEDISEDTQEICIRIRGLMLEKLERMERREAFNKYKTATGGSEGREAARKEYLDRAEIPKDYRSDKEINLFDD